MVGFTAGGPVEDDHTFLIHNIRGYTIQADTLTNFDAMFVEHGKVYATGRDSSLRARFPGHKQVNGRGHVLLPGMIDAHGHIMSLGFSRLTVNLAGTRSLEEALERVVHYAEQHPEAAWIQGRGWNQTLWGENKFPVAADLDRAVGDRPVWLVRIDSHAGWANSLALQAAGITAGTPDPPGGQIIRHADGSPTGVLVDNAMLSGMVPEPTAGEKRRALDEALTELRSAGLTGVHDAGTGIEPYNLFKEYGENGRLTTRIYAMIDGTGETFDRMGKDGPQTLFQDKLVLRSVKIITDGALGSRGAALLESYSDDPDNHGLLFHDAAGLASKIEKAALRGFQVNIHAIGDRANRLVLDAHERVRRRHGKTDLRHRIEHAQVVSPGDFPRFAELNIIASVQPTHATSDMNMAGARLGQQRIRGAYAWRTLWDQKIPVASGSDFPIEETNPFHGLFSAVARTDLNGHPNGGWYPEQAMTREEAFRSFTINAAFAAHQEKVTGSLERGKWADFILVDKDPFAISLSEIPTIRVLETWLGGDRVYKR
ncbi:MAG: amidohydrolase [Balneolales bacterium]